MSNGERDYFAEEFMGPEVPTEPEFPIEDHLDPEAQRRLRRMLGRTFHSGGDYVGDMRLKRWNPDYAQQVDSPRTTALISTIVRRMRKMWRGN